ncbi:MAG: HAMP domain-containing histidine kinase [Planctomycetes bacterium]|nr:HAMP domain-containing histidine kinase [Planctomycetota bacterium]
MSPDGSWQFDDPRLAPGGPVRIVAAEALPPAALAVVPGLGVLPVAGPSTSPLASARGLAIVLGALGSALVATLLLVVRGVLREAAAISARSRFLTSVTHELKTPLASIRLLTEMLAGGRAAADKQDEYHRLLAGEAERLSALIENVLDAGELARGERALQHTSQRLDLLLEDVLQRVAPLLERDGVRVERRLSQAPCVASVDRGAFAQIVINLLDNARKYAASGGRVVVELQGVSTRSPASDGAASRDAAIRMRVRVRVRDFGPGIAAGDRASLFTPFVRGAAQADGATPGLGLGLHLARTLAQRHGGELACIEPDDGGPGACFELTLPIGGTPQ